MFHLIVTCVGSKKYEGPSIKNAMDNLIQNNIRDDIEELFNEWNQMILHHMESSYRSVARDLYIKAMWNASMEAFHEIKEKSRLWILSCGFGFINSEDMISGYKATFSSRKPDSLYNREYFFTLTEDEVKRQWWDILTEKAILQMDNPRSIHELIEILTEDDIVLLVAGKDYYEAIMNDLSKIKITEYSPRLALIGIKKDFDRYEPTIPEELHSHIIPYSNRDKLHQYLKETCGKCNKTQINPKTALCIIRHYNKTRDLVYRLP